MSMNTVASVIGMPVRRVSTSFSRLLRGSSYCSWLPVKPSCPKTNSVTIRSRMRRRGRAAEADLEVIAGHRAHPLELAQRRRWIEPRIGDAREQQRAMGQVVGGAGSGLGRARRPAASASLGLRAALRPVRARCQAIEQREGDLPDMLDHLLGVGRGRRLDSWSRHQAFAGRRRAPTAAPTPNPRWRRRATGSSRRPARSDIDASAREYGSGAGLPRGVSPAATMTGTSDRRPAPSRICSISCRSAPDAIAIGTAAAAARTQSAAPSNST